MANELKMVEGSSTTVISLAATLANAANTYTGLTGLTNTQYDNSSLMYPYARAVLNIPDTFAAAPTQGGTFDLFMVKDDVDGTSDETPEPAATDIYALATWVGAWIVDNQDVAHIRDIIIDTLGVKKARYFLMNNCGQTASYTSNPITVKLFPLTVAPA